MSLSRLPWLVLLVAGALVLGSPCPDVAAQPQRQAGGPVIELAATGADRANALAFSPDGKRLAVGSALGLYLYDAVSFTQAWFSPTDTWVRALAFSPDGHFLASGSYDASVRIWRASDGVLVKTLAGHASWVRSVAFAPEGDLLASASDDNTIRLWRLLDGKLLATITEGVDGVRALAFSPDGQTLATGGFDNLVRLWRVVDPSTPAPAEAGVNGGGRGGTPLLTLEGHTGWVRCLAFSPDGSLLATGGFDATARLWRVRDGALLRTLTGHTASVLGAAFSPDGRILATGSVDTTVRLWRIPGGTPAATLSGHADFVFGVAFAPDGRTLASGGVDNSVRLWPLDAEGLPVEGSAEPDLTASTASASCVRCHHPQGDLLQPGGSVQPPRVIEVSCATCHADGALVLKWDPEIPRDPGPLTVAVAPPSVSDKIGVPHGNSLLDIVIGTPGNGEFLYAGSEVLSITPVSGRVRASAGQAAEVMVSLEIWSGQRLAAALTTRPKPDGNFSFAVNLNAEGSLLQVPLELGNCVACHDPSYENLGGGVQVPGSLPAGEVRLLVRAETADGAVALDERWITVDRSGSAMVPFRLMMAGATSQALPTLPVMAEAKLYEWRARTFSAMTEAGGAGQVLIEALAQAPTHYTFQIPPTVVDGVLYESVAPAEVTLPPGATEAAPVTLVVRAQHGSLAGQLSGAVNATPVSVWAIRQTDGLSDQAHATAEGAFTFAELPIAPYLIVADAEALAAQGLSAAPVAIDLAQAPRAEVTLALTPLEGLTLHGAVGDSQGQPLPFAWLASADASRARPVSPDTGVGALLGLPPASRSLVALAPGFYSQALPLDNSGNAFAFRLSERPDTRHLAWGEGEIVLPADTQAVLNGNRIGLDRGWLWGEGAAAQPVTIEVGGYTISLPGGRFALERPLGQTGWLYLFAGTAQVQRAGQPPQAVSLAGGMMLALPEAGGLQAVPLNPVAIAALHSGNPAPAPVWEPALSAQVRDRLGLLGVTTAQVITFTTYTLALAALVVLPLLGLMGWRRRIGGGS